MTVYNASFKYEQVPDEDAPPAYDHSKAIFIRDEKRAAISKQELDLLGCEKGVKSPNFLGIHYKAILLVYTMLLSFFQVMTFSLSLTSDHKLAAASAFMGAMLHIIGFTALMLEKQKLLKAFLGAYMVHFVMSTVFSGYSMLMLWSPSFCHDLASTVSGVSYQQCKSNLGMLRAVGSTMVMGQFFWEWTVLYMFRKVYEHEEKMENPKKPSKPKTTSLLMV